MGKDDDKEQSTPLVLTSRKSTRRRAGVESAGKTNLVNRRVYMSVEYMSVKKAGKKKIIQVKPKKKDD